MFDTLAKISRWMKGGHGPLDRRGYRRGDAYRQEDYVLCPCCPKPPHEARATCAICGGYGEIPKACIAAKLPVDLLVQCESMLGALEAFVAKNRASAAKVDHIHDEPPTERPQ